MISLMGEPVETSFRTETDTGPARMRQAENEGQCPWRQCKVERTKDCCFYALCLCYSSISRSRPLVLLPLSPTALGLVTMWPFGPLCSMCPPSACEPPGLTTTNPSVLPVLGSPTSLPLASSPLLTVLILVFCVLALSLAALWFFLLSILVSSLSCPSLILFYCQVGSSAWYELT